MTGQKYVRNELITNGYGIVNIITLKSRFSMTTFIVRLMPLKVNLDDILEYLTFLLMH